MLLLALSCDPEGSSSSGGSAPTKPKAWRVSTIPSFVTFPFSIAQVGDMLYVTSSYTMQILAIDKNGVRADEIGRRALSGGYENGKATAAEFQNPKGLVLTAGNTLYVVDSLNHRIRRVRIGTTAATTQVSNFAGSGRPGHANGTGAAAQFNFPSGLAVSGSTLYVADSDNHRIRTIDIASGAVRDLAGSGRPGHANGTGAAAQFNSPMGLAVSGSTLYVADFDNHRIRAVDIASGAVRDLAGSGTPGHANGTGAAAQFKGPVGVAVSGTTLYVADSDNHRIRAVDIASGAVRDLAGSGRPGKANGTGAAAQFNNPMGLAVSGTTLYVADFNNSLVRKLEYR